MITPATSLIELAFIVCTAFERAGECIVLVGGGAATFYAPDAYQSRDLDFISSVSFMATTVTEMPLRELGFQRHLSHYRHPETPFTIDFPVGPIMIDRELVTSWNRVEDRGMVLNVIDATDCVRDRLLYYFYGGDGASLRQAIDVAKVQPLDWPRLENWVASRDRPVHYRTFCDLLAREASE